MAATIRLPPVFGPSALVVPALLASARFQRVQRGVPFRLLLECFRRGTEIRGSGIVHDRPP